MFRYMYHNQGDPGFLKEHQRCEVCRTKSVHAEGVSTRQSKEMSPPPRLNPPLAMNVLHSNNEEYALFQIKDGASQNLPPAHLDDGNRASIHLESLQGLARYGRRDVWKLTFWLNLSQQKTGKLNKDEFTVYQTWMSGYTASVHLESLQLQGLACYSREMCENWHSGWTWANKTLGNWIRMNLQCTKLGWVDIQPAFIWNLDKASSVW